MGCRQWQRTTDGGTKLRAVLDLFRAWLASVLIALGIKRRCPQCGAEVSASARTCFMCGETLPAPRRRTQQAGVAKAGDRDRAKVFR